MFNCYMWRKATVSGGGYREHFYHHKKFTIQLGQEVSRSLGEPEERKKEDSLSVYGYDTFI